MMKLLHTLQTNLLQAFDTRCEREHETFLTKPLLTRTQILWTRRFGNLSGQIVTMTYVEAHL